MCSRRIMVMTPFLAQSPRHSGSGRPPVSPLLGQIFGFARHGHKFESRSVAGRRSSAPGKIEATTEAFGESILMRILGPVYAEECTGKLGLFA